VIRVPAEWEKQEMVLMAFPHYNTDWSDDISSAYSIFIRIASTISYSQKLLLLVEPDSGDIVKEMFCYHNNISFIPYRVDDTWIRDYGPISIYSDDQRVLKKFIFNGWGGKFNSDRDNQAANHIYKSLYFGPSKLLEVDFILEGGSIDFDGAGTALVTSRSILTRNPHLTKNEIEAILGRELGINRFLWLDHGYLAGDDTDGHIDMLARFVSRETIVFLECLDRDDEHFQELSMMKEEFKSRAYCDLFYHEVKTIVDRLDKFIDRLSSLEDHTFDLKKEHINYLNSIKTALRESDTTRLIKRWADVDRVWMKITSPLQIGHPLEYYEDHYRKAVAPEWDLRIINPNSSAGDTIDDIKNMYNSIYMELKNVSRETKKTFDNSMKSLDQVQLYLGRPALFYGAELDGQFSAQVVPNDEVVSKECGKKIFAFADSILESARAKPFLKIHSKIFPSNFLHKSRLSLFGDQKKWHSIYNITTIGHEYGHILWIDDDSETVMNRGGNFKNIEEFKATTGGLVAFFLNDKDELIEDIIIDTVKRAVGLISWRETYEVQPYYCEGLIHLKGLFDSGVLSFNGSLEIDMSIKRYMRLKEWYIKTYKELATHYLLKEDATIFLNRYLIKKDQTFDPIDTNIKSFVDYYWRLYKDIGQVIDDKIDKNSYIK
jgi:agmatine/peptidylarginine deiminase